MKHKPGKENFLLKPEIIYLIKNGIRMMSAQTAIAPVLQMQVLVAFQIVNT